ncbi:MAG: methyl-accepting chemotaxis protein [Selenomonadaceae bacterium]|nr:methyl-accepting chemotaxis protein [Selenomonadaceae bacterium]
MAGLSITKKLIGAFGLVFVFISFFGLFILYSFNGLSSERANVRDWLDSSLTVSQIAGTIDDVQRMVHMRVARIGTADGTSLQAEQQKIIADIDTAFKHYQQVIDKGDYDDEAERQRDQEMLNSEVKAWQYYKEQLIKIEPLISSGNRDGSIAILNNEVERAFAEISKAMDIDVADCAEGLAAAVDVSEKTFEDFEELVHVMGLVIGAILVFVVGILYLLAKNIRHSVQQIVTVTERAAKGDLSHDIVTDATDEFGVIAGQFNSVIQHMRKALGKVQSAAQQVSDSSVTMKTKVNETGQLLENVAMAVTQASENAEEQAKSLVRTEEHVKQMEHDVEQSIEAIKIGLDSVEQTSQHASNGTKMADVTIRQMNEISAAVEEAAQIVQKLGENSKEIGSIVELISSISEQTNLLALNAAIEAARAGEHGRGFAVVADEVRKLAEESQNAVQRIGSIIGTIQETTEKAVITMKNGSQRVEEGKVNIESTGKSFHEIVTMIQQSEENSQQVMLIIDSLREPIKDIVNRTQRLSSASTEIAQKMLSISIDTAEQAAKVIELSDDSTSLTELSQNMKATVNEFQLD